MKILFFNRPLSSKSIWGLRHIIFHTIIRILNPKVAFNLCLFIYSRFMKRTKVSHLPFYIMIEPTSRCNIKCSMCKRSLFGFNREEKDMPYEKFTSIIDKLTSSLVGIAFWNYGEPLLNSELPKMIKYVTKKGIISAVSTNGLLLNQKNIIKLIKSGLKYLIIGIDGSSPEIYKQYRCGGNFELLKNNIKELCQIKENLGSKFPIIELQCVLMKNNEDDTANFFALSKELGVDRAVIKKFHTSLRYKRTNIFLPLNTDFVAETHCYNKIYQRNFCKTPWETMVINSDGSVIPCCSDYFTEQSMGNAFNDDIRKIWNNKKYISFRSQVIKNIADIKLCTDCSTIGGQEGSFIETKQLT
jgi:radical SAM protein with 4Fe4S-binding SPASM domain